MKDGDFPWFFVFCTFSRSGHLLAAIRMCEGPVLKQIAYPMPFRQLDGSARVGHFWVSLADE